MNHLAQAPQLSGPLTTRAVPRIAILDPHQRAPKLLAPLFAGSGNWACEFVDVTSNAVPLNLEAFDAAIWVDDNRSDWAQSDFTARLLADSPNLLILTDRPDAFGFLPVPHVCLNADCPHERLEGALQGLAAAGASLRNVRAERQRVRRVNESVNHYFEAMDYELRLASRLQREFMPPASLRVGPLHFSTIYRPCSWVSGDIFDIFRLDDTHIGFYIADAVGHGVAAGLLTMYIKYTIQPRRPVSSGYEIVSPGFVLGRLNEHLASQELPDSQFVTLWYGVLNLDSLRLDYAVAGHPPAMRISSGGEMSELQADGSLLGISQDQRFDDASVQLSCADRIILYSDGVENAILGDRPSPPAMPELLPGVPELLRLPRKALLPALHQRLDSAPGSLNRADDVTMLILDVEASNSMSSQQTFDRAIP